MSQEQNENIDVKEVQEQVAEIEAADEQTQGSGQEKMGSAENLETVEVDESFEEPKVEPEQEQADIEEAIETNDPESDAQTISEDAPLLEDEEDEDDGTKDVLNDEIETNVENVIEAILFASDEPLTKARLVKIAELSSSKQVTDSVKSLNKQYRETGRCFRVERIAGGYQMMTLPVFNTWLRKMQKVKTDSKLSQAALETLAVIAYKQPVIRANVEAIRGVASGEMIRSLMYKGLVKIVGREEVIGRPLLYGTTKKFLEVFGLNSLKDLPDVEELKKPS